MAFRSAVAVAVAVGLVVVVAASGFGGAEAVGGRRDIRGGLMRGEGGPGTRVSGSDRYIGGSFVMWFGNVH